jgi:hypothetical protein
MGSATVVGVKIESENTLTATWIGDSGYALFHIVEDDQGNYKLQQYFRSKEG